MAESFHSVRIGAFSLRLGNDSLGSHEIVRLPDEPGIMTTLGVDVFQGRKVGFALKDDRLALNPAKHLPDTFELGQRGHVILPLSVDSAKARMIWDTGAGLTLLDQSFIDAHASEFRFIKKIKVGDAVVEGASEMNLYEAQELAVAGVHFKQVKVLATDFSYIREKLQDPTLQGAIGFNILRHYNWYFDFQTRTFALE